MRRDLFVSADVGNPLKASPSVSANRIIVQKDWGLKLEGALCMIRLDAAGQVERIVLCEGKSIAVGGVIVELKQKTSLVEIVVENGRTAVVSGTPGKIEEIKVTRKGER